MLPLFAALFAIFPLTDTDIWWHLACAREWVVTWTPMRQPAVNIHEYFQQVVYAIYSVGGAPLLVAFKALLWGVVFWLFAPKKFWCGLVAIPFVFLFRFHMEMRPILFSLLFLGIFWRLLPILFLRVSPENSGTEENRRRIEIGAIVVALLLLQWLWCRIQGLYILGPIFVGFLGASALVKKQISWKFFVGLVAALFLMPFLHAEGWLIFKYPLGLLDRLLGASASASIFANRIAENRSPIMLARAGVNLVPCWVACIMAAGSIVHCACLFYKNVGQNKPAAVLLNGGTVWLLIVAILALVAERNIILFLPVFVASMHFHFPQKQVFLVTTLLLVVICFVLGMWVKSLSLYHFTMVSEQRVPVAAAEWCRNNPHPGRLFNDDRAGGYLAFTHPSDSIYLDGRFILKTADFFEHYLNYERNPDSFFKDADSLGIDRVVLPIKFYAHWKNLLGALMLECDGCHGKKWHQKYRDRYYVVFDRDLD
ncbi:MAG: hypothetical protein HUK21_05680 [Fibrobacteraceae bacterium]|nr:hypothetical protein [Fibrobacteraceae bacterium]